MEREQAHSFAKTPLKAAHAPDVMAKKSQADLVGVAIVGVEVCLLLERGAVTSGLGLLLEGADLRGLSQRVRRSILCFVST